MPPALATRKPMARKIEPQTDLGRRLLAFIKAKGHPSLRRGAMSTEKLDYQQLYDLVTSDKDPRLSTLVRVMKELGGTMEDLYRPLPAEKTARKPKKSN